MNGVDAVGIPLLVCNGGVISADGFAAIFLGAGGSVTNASGGTIYGPDPAEITNVVAAPVHQDVFDAYPER